MNRFDRTTTAGSSRRTWARRPDLLMAAFATASIFAWYARGPIGLQAALNSGPDSAELAVAQVLARLPEVDRVPELVRFLQSPNPGLRYAAANALRDQKGPAAADALDLAYSDNSAAVRKCALEGLKRIDRPRGLRVLIQGLQDEDNVMRETATFQLASALRADRREGDLALVPVLMRSVDDPDRDVAASVMSALCKLTGLDIRASRLAPELKRHQAVARWKSWWKAHGRDWPRSLEWENLWGRRPERADPAPQFRITDMSGKTISLSGQRGRVTLLNFRGTWSAPSRVGIPHMVKLDRDYRDAGLDIVGLTVGETNGRRAVLDFCSAAGSSYPQAVCTQQLQADYGNVTEVPASVLIDKQGRIRRRWEGPRDLSTYSRAIETLLSE